LRDGRWSERPGLSVAKACHILHPRRNQSA
jgi:hypothetical protein